MAASKKKRVVEKEMEYLENEKADSDDEVENGEDDMEELSDEEEDDAVGQQVEGSSEEDDDDEIMDVDDIFGVVSVINITERKDLESVNELKSYLLDKCHRCAPKYHEKLSSVLNGSSQQVGFVINERFINIPAQIALPSFESLWKEVERAKKKKMKYDFDYILMISKSFKLEMPSAATAGSKKSGTIQDSPLLFTNEEEEFFRDEAEFSFDYSVKEERDTVVGGDWDGEEGEMEPLRTVMLISADKITVIMQKLQATLALTPYN